MNYMKQQQDINDFKQLLEENPSVENGWELVYNDRVSRRFPDSHIKVYKKMNTENEITTRIEGSLANVAAENLFKMMKELPIMLTCGAPLLGLKNVEKLSSNSEILYFGMKLPFPFTNRDFLQKRFFFGNKEDPGLAKEFGLYDWSHKYYVLMNRSIEREDYPHRQDFVRAQAKMNYWLIEEDPVERTKVRFRQIACQNMGGKLNVPFVNAMGVRTTPSRIETILENYRQIYGSKENF